MIWFYRLNKQMKHSEGDLKELKKYSMFEFYSRYLKGLDEDDDENT